MAVNWLKTSGRSQLQLGGKAVVQRELIVRRKDTGKEVVISVNATPVRDASGKVTMAVVTAEGYYRQETVREGVDSQRKAGRRRPAGLDDRP